MFDKLMLDLVFNGETELPKPKLYQRMGRFYFTREQTRDTVKLFQKQGLLKPVYYKRQAFYTRV